MRKLLSIFIALALSFGAMQGCGFPLNRADKEATSRTASAPLSEVRRQEKQNRSASGEEAAIFDASDAPGSREISKTITVMTTATGNPDRGNYIESKPIKSALVRVDGVPRYTDRKGQITVPLLREYSELYVERTGYNPYIEIIEATDDEKTVYLKQPDDDIEIFGVMLDYYGEDFNLMLQPCYYLKGQMETAAFLTVTANVEYDYIWFYVNDELDKFGFADGIVFTDEDLDSYRTTDEFSLKISYQGIDSKKVPLQLIIEEFDPRQMRKQILSSAEKSEDVQFDVGNDESGIGQAGTISANKDQIFETLVDTMFGWGSDERSVLAKNERGWPDFFNSIEIPTSPVGPVVINFVFDLHNGTIQIVGGFQFDVQDTVDQIKDAVKAFKDKKKKYREIRDERYAEIAKKMHDAQLEYDKLRYEIDKLKETQSDQTEKIEELNRKLKLVEEKRAEGKAWTKEEGYRLYRDEKGRFMESAKGVAEELNKANDEYKDILKKVTDAQNNLKKLGKSASKAIESFLQDYKGIKKRTKKIVDVFRNGGTNGGGFGCDLELSVMATIKFSYRTGEVIELTAYAEFQVKPSFTYHWYIPTPVIVIPIFVKIEGLIGLKAEVFFIHESQPRSVSEAFKQIDIVLELGLRIDGGVGICGAASVGVYGKVQFDWHLIYPQFWEFAWGAGVKVQFLMFELELGYDAPPVTLGKDSSEEQATLLARMAASPEHISANQVFDRIYQSSRPQIVRLGDGRQMLLWIEDDAGRDDYNRSVVKYSIFDQGVWSAPKPVAGDGRGDYAFDVCINGNDVFVALQRSKDLVSAADTVESVMRGTEIFAAAFDANSGTFGKPVQLTDNDVYDAMPQFAVGGTDSSVTLCWQTNTANDYLGLSGQNVLYSSTFAESGWTNRTERFRLDKPLYAYSAAVEESGFSLAVCGDADGDILTPGTRTEVRRGGETVLVSDAMENPKFIRLPSGTALAYYREGCIWVTEDNTAGSVAVSGTASQDFGVSKTGDVPALFYESSDGKAEQACCALFSDGKWTSGITVTDEAIPDADLFALAGYYENGAIYSAYHFRKIDEVNKLDTPTVLCVAKKERGYAIETEAYAFEGIREGEKSTIGLYVENLGDFDIGRLSVTVSGERIEVVCEPRLTVGEGRYFDLTLTPRFGEQSELLLRTEVPGPGDAVMAYHETRLRVRTDLRLQVDRTIHNGKQRFGIDVTNLSDVDSRYSLLVYVNGELFAKEESRFLSAHASDVSSMTFDAVDEGDYICFEVVPEEAEYAGSDNYVGLYSLQTEKIIAPPTLNPYHEALTEAKRVTA